MTNLTAIMRKDLQTQEAFITDIENLMPSMPEGSLYQIKNAHNRYYFQNKYADGERKRVYLGTQNGQNKKTISELKRKRFLLGCKKTLMENTIALRACLQKYKELDPTQIGSRLATSYKNIENAPATEDAADWRHSQYPRAEMHPENLKHETVGGLRVRSKSEALIAFALDIAKVPFHYEEILELQGKKIVPDFTILHPATGEKLYWEHFGIMDDPDYARETYKKLVWYGQNGILPGKSLIITMETENEPLGIQNIRQLIECFLL